MIFIPRPYQTETCDNAIQLFHDGKKSVIAILATGLGKTVIGGIMARKIMHLTDKRTLFISNRKNLVNQTYKTMCDFNLFGGIEMGESHVLNPHSQQFVCASVQSLTKKRLEKYNPDDFGLILIDEAHHDKNTNKSYARVREHFQSVWTMGLTATPVEQLKHTYEATCMNMGALRGINEGWLCPLVPRKVECLSIDISSIESNRRDFRDGELSALFDDEALNEIVVGIKNEHEGKPFIVFMPGVKEAGNLTLNLKAEGFKVECIVGNTPDEQRERVFNGFADGSVQGIIGCMVLTEGFDAPNVAKIFNCRSTKSMELMTQIVGRVLRTLPGTITPEMYDSRDARIEAIAKSAKPFGEFLDVSGNAGIHKIKTPLDIVGHPNPEVIQFAQKELMPNNRTLNIEDVIDKAEKELEERARILQQEKLAKLASKLRISGESITKEFSLFDGSVDEFIKKHQPAKLSYKDKMTLQRARIDWRRMTIKDAESKAKEIRQAYTNEPTPAQIKHLNKFGETARNKNHASAILSMIAGNGWRPRKAKLLSKFLCMKKVDEVYYPFYDDGTGRPIQLSTNGGPIGKAQKFLESVKED